MEEREISISPMFKWFGRRSEKKKRKTRLLWGREFNIVKEGLDEQQIADFVNNLVAEQKASQQSSADSLRSLLETAVTDAEQMAASIKVKAQTEAEAEAATIINQAKQEAQEIKGRAEIATQKEVEDILSVANRRAEITEVEAKQKALLFLLRAREDIEKEIREEWKRAYGRLLSPLQDLMNEGQNIEIELRGKRVALWASKNLGLKEPEAALLSTSGAAAAPPETLAPIETQIEPDIASKEKTEEPPMERIEQPIQLEEEPPMEKIEQPVQLEEEPPMEKIEQPTQLQDEVTVSELLEATTEEHPPEERPGRRETESARLKVDSQTLYTGEVELAIAMPVDLVTVSNLYNHLQTIPELRILRTTGSWDQGTIITVVLDKPLPLLSMISKIPGVELTPQLSPEDSLAKATSGVPPGAKRRGAKRIKLALKEAQPPVGG